MTGPAADAGDRVIELAIMHLDPSGQITGCWDTLINPLRNTGHKAVHRIGHDDVTYAPTFAEAAPQMIELLDGRALVTHDPGSFLFLDAELERMGYSPPPLTLTSLCTTELAQEFLPDGHRLTLAACCIAYAIPYTPHHRALTDAEATARLLQRFLSIVPGARIWAATLASADTCQWPALDWAIGDWFSRDDVRQAA